MIDSIALVGFASGVAANNPDCALGPWYMYYHPKLFEHRSLSVTWQPMIVSTTSLRSNDALPSIAEGLNELSQAVLALAIMHHAFCVIGGDHSCAISTWSAVAHANRIHGDIGLIWIDAHMDSHTPETSPTQNVHGMPVAHLLGYGIPSLCAILDEHPKIKPENLCLIGIRSYESGEAQLLSQLGVKIYYMEDIIRDGIEAVLAHAVQQVSAATCGYGVSIDLDGIDPTDAPGVGYRVAAGIPGKELVQALTTIPHKEKLLGLEIAEFNPIRDEKKKTAELLVDLIHAVYA